MNLVERRAGLKRVAVRKLDASHASDTRYDVLELGA